jgi:hypothetical protein
MEELCESCRLTTPNTKETAYLTSWTRDEPGESGRISESRKETEPELATAPQADHRCANQTENRPKKTKNPVGYSPTRSLFERGFFKDFRGLNHAFGVSSKRSPPELRSYKQNQGTG